MFYMSVFCVFLCFHLHMGLLVCCVELCTAVYVVYLASIFSKHVNACQANWEKQPCIFQQSFATKILKCQSTEIISHEQLNFSEYLHQPAETLIIYTITFTIH